MLAYQNQDIKILENSFLAIPIEMAENTLCFQFKLLSLQDNTTTQIMSSDNSQRYAMRGVSASKEDVHNAIKNIDKSIGYHLITHL